jgi:RNA polymerase sigma-32 factor
MTARLASRNADDEERGPSHAAPTADGPFAHVLGHYVVELRHCPPISREEEHALAMGAQRGDRRSAERLLTANLRLVVKIARDYRHAQVSVQDLVQEGNLGLVIAVRKFDPSRGVKLSTYGAWWIRAYMLKFILDNSRLVRWGTTQAQRKLFFSLRKEQQKLAAQGIDPSSALLSEMLHVPEHAVIEMDRRIGQSELSLDAPTQNDDDGSRSLMDRLPSDDHKWPDRLAEEHELKARLDQSLTRFRGSLDERDQHILDERILTEAPATLDRIGARFRISRERARQLEHRLNKRLESFVGEDIVGGSATAPQCG